MAASAAASADLLPAALPVFPLTGSLLLPGNWLPLNVFEPRYRNLVEDTIGKRPERQRRGRHGDADPGDAGHRHPEPAGGPGDRRLPSWIGMIQPRVPQQDNWPALDAPPTNPELYTVGCAGRIERCEAQPDGRYLILLKGVSRFRVRRELTLRHGYRRVAADYSEFAADLGEPALDLDPAPVLRALRAFGQQQGLCFDFDVLAALTGVALLNGLAVALPFPPAEKQLLLEAEGPHQRQQLLLTLMGMGVEPPGSGDYYAPPVVH
ncbi:MAG TPA: LON peptidase substrate-binding domain-containing protein [Thermoanaerobaculia bacterium]|nr:LON peptidase substrate-binding domain-containing protein [Thermoanaerobaculia bacterium]